MVKAIKGSSSRWINEASRIQERFAWQEGYAAFSVSQSVLERVRAYVLRQEQHHRQASLRAEQKDLLTKHGILFEESDLDD